MKYQIDRKPDHIEIEVSTETGEQQQLLEAFQACQSGTCSCPTHEYSKLDSFEVKTSDDAISLKLTAKEGLQLDENEIGRCLEHTKAHIHS